MKTYKAGELREDMLVVPVHMLEAATPSEDGWEVPEVVGYQSTSSGLLYEEPCGLDAPDELMTVAQHSRIVAAKDAEIARLRELHENAHSAAKTLMAEKATLMEQAAHWLEVNAPSGGCIETNIADELRAEAEQLRAQPSRQVGGDAKPVAWRVSTNGEWQYFTSREAAQRERDEYEEYGKDDPDMEHEEAQPLYRAALAPAAVVMPERKPIEYGKWRPVGVYEGFNAALDEVARLNRRAIPVELLERALYHLELSYGDMPTIRELRALLGNY